MLTPQSETLHGAAIKMHVRWKNASVTIGAALELCRSDDFFRSQLIAALAAAPFAAYYWEAPPVAASTLDRPFEFVLTEATGLAKAAPNLNAFRQHFGSDHDRDGVVVFENLGRDATLVVPCPLASTDTYVHLAAFLRGAPEAQRGALFRCVADEVLSCVGSPLVAQHGGHGRVLAACAARFTPEVLSSHAVHVGGFRLLPRLTWVAIFRLKAEATWLPALAGRTCSPYKATQLNMGQRVTDELPPKVPCRG